MHYTLEGLEAFSGTINDLFRAVAPINLFELGADWEIYLAALRVNEAARSSVLEGWYAVCGMPEPDRERRENEAVQREKPRMATRYDTVWYWRGGRWQRTALWHYKMRREIEHMGYVAYDGRVSIGPPDDAPTTEERDAVIRAHMGHSAEDCRA